MGVVPCRRTSAQFVFSMEVLQRLMLFRMRQNPAPDLDLPAAATDCVFQALHPS
jgi:hypothetical protein